MVKCAIVGLGQRGRLYGHCITESQNAELVAVLDPSERMQNYAQDSYGIAKEQCYGNEDEFFALGKIADLLFICTQDALHYDQALKALDLGYDIVLEKPIATSAEQCKEIAKKANSLGRKVYVCHVLRYAPFFTEIKKLIADGTLGKVQHIDQTELVGYWHQAHSFVRGNWRKAEDSNPMIIAKCCHDLDIIAWLMDTKCTKVSSFGSLDYFRRENAPEGCAEYCFECKLERECPFSCINFYTTWPDWLCFNSTYTGDEKDKEAIKQYLSSKENTKYARCVFHCDNDVVDHQSVSALFDNGAIGHLTMNGFNKGCYRSIRVYGTKGEVDASMDQGIIRYRTYTHNLDEPWKIIDVNNVEKSNVGHGGGDPRMVDDIISAMMGEGGSLGLTNINNSIMSHLMGFAAEESRLNGGSVIDIDYD